MAGHGLMIPFYKPLNMNILGTPYQKKNKKLPRYHAAYPVFNIVIKKKRRALLKRRIKL